MRNPQTLKIATINADWCDKDQVMLHACFQLLTDFVDQEISQDIVDWEHDEKQRQVRKEIDFLYNWWKQRIKDEAEQNLDPIWSERLHDIDDEMLTRLIKIRRHLWT
jgi:hypothetical protein